MNKLLLRSISRAFHGQCYICTSINYYVSEIWEYVSKEDDREKYNSVSRGCSASDTARARGVGWDLISVCGFFSFLTLGMSMNYHQGKFISQPSYYPQPSLYLPDWKTSLTVWEKNNKANKTISLIFTGNTSTTFLKLSSCTRQRAFGAQKCTAGCGSLISEMRTFIGPTASPPT